MVIYPLSPNNCRTPFPRSACPDYPCNHTIIHDPDWVEDDEDAARDFEFWVNLWVCFWSESISNLPEGVEVSPEEWAVFERKFDRCRRMTEKHALIKRAEDIWPEIDCDDNAISFVDESSQLDQTKEKLKNMRLCFT